MVEENIFLNFSGLKWTSNNHEFREFDSYSSKYNFSLEIWH